MNKICMKIAAMLMTALLTVGLVSEAFASQDAQAFSDVPNGAWYEEAVYYVTAMNVTSGVGEGRFGPKVLLSRAMFVTMLYRLAGSPTVDDSKQIFDDVPLNTWYTKSVAWADAQGITVGTGESRFNPKAPIIRQDMAVMIVRFAQSQNAEFLTDDMIIEMFFADMNCVSDYAKRAVVTCGQKGIFGGDKEGNFMPKKNANRAEAAQVIRNLALLMNQVPAHAEVIDASGSRILSAEDTVRAYRLFHSNLWTPSEYAEFIPAYTLDLWGTKYLIPAREEGYNGFNIIFGERYSGYIGDPEDLAAIYSLIER